MCQCTCEKFHQVDTKTISYSLDNDDFRREVETLITKDVILIV